MMGTLDRCGFIDSYQGVGGRIWGGCYLKVFFAFVFCSLVSSVSLFLIDYSMIAVASVSVFIICFLILWSI